MTREEIKNIVRHIFHFYEVNAKDCNWTDMNEACGEIFKALEQKPCEDAISRQAVLDYIDNVPGELTADGRGMIRRRTLEEYISDTLLPVIPQPKIGHWIDAYGDNAICGCCNRLNHLYGTYCKHCGAKMEVE